VAFPAKLNPFGEAGLCSFVMVKVGNVPVLLPTGAAPVVPGGTLIMLPGVKVILLRTLVRLPDGFNTPPSAARDS
jgi:hypothetical protein